MITNLHTETIDKIKLILSNSKDIQRPFTVNFTHISLCLFLENVIRVCGNKLDDFVNINIIVINTIGFYQNL